MATTVLIPVRSVSSDRRSWITLRNSAADLPQRPLKNKSTVPPSKYHKFQHLRVTKTKTKFRHKIKMNEVYTKSTDTIIQRRWILFRLNKKTQLRFKCNQCTKLNTCVKQWPQSGPFYSKVKHQQILREKTDHGWSVSSWTEDHHHVIVLMHWGES